MPPPSIVTDFPVPEFAGQSPGLGDFWLEKSPKENGCCELEIDDNPVDESLLAKEGEGVASADEEPQLLIPDPNPIAASALIITEEPAALPIFSKNSLRCIFFSGLFITLIPY